MKSGYWRGTEGGYDEECTDESHSQNIVWYTPHALRKSYNIQKGNLQRFSNTSVICTETFFCPK